MKTITLSLIVTFFIAGFSNATVRTVDNNTNRAVGAYADISNAIAASSAGDTIYVQGSGFVYNQTYTLDKRLVIIGPGHNPSTQNPLTAQVSTIIVTAAGSDSKIIGICFTGPLYFQSNANGVTVQRCKFGLSTTA